MAADLFEAILNVCKSSESLAMDDGDDRMALADSIQRELIKRYHITPRGSEEVPIRGTWLLLLVASQGWDDDTLKSLAFNFIELYGLAPLFQEFVTQAAAKEENDGNEG